MEANEDIFCEELDSDEDIYLPYNQIEEHLYLGNWLIPTDTQALDGLKIKKILTITTEALPAVDGIICKHINAEDDPSEDLLTYFPECIEFISEGMKNNDNVYVHCMAGMSRSATVVIAFIMKKYQKSVIDASNYVKIKRKHISPNAGFVSQLKLFEKMNYSLDANNREFRKYLVNSYTEKVWFKSFCINKYFERLEIAEVMTENLTTGIGYNCAKCGTKLFSQINIIENSSLLKSNTCGDTYIEPQNWMISLADPKSVADLTGGQNNCPNCDTLVSKFNRIYKTFRCDCDKHISINYLKIKVENNKFKPQKN